MTTHYKIRHKKTGRFRLPGTYGGWSVSGKTWDTLGKLRAALTLAMHKPWEDNDFDNWEIVEYEVVEKAVKDVSDVITPKRLIELLTNSKR